MLIDAFPWPLRIYFLLKLIKNTFTILFKLIKISPSLFSFKCEDINKITLGS